MPLMSACSSSSPSTLAFDANLGGAVVEAILRGSFIPALDDHTRALGARWEESRDATLSLNLSDGWREFARKTANDRRGADVAELFSNAAHVLSGRLVDVSDLAERIGEKLGGWSEVARSGCVVDGVWRSVPWSMTYHSLVTRTDLFDQVGAALPATYDELLEAATLLHEAGAPSVGFTMGEEGPNDSAALAYAMLWSFGGQEVDESGRVALDSAATKQALDYFAELGAVNDRDALGYTEVGNNNAFLEGQISMTQNASSIYWRAVELGLPMASSIQHLAMPAGPAGRFRLPELNSLAVYRHSEELTAALDWIEFATDEEVMVERADVSEAFHVPPAPGLDGHPSMPWVGNRILGAFATSAAEGRMPGWPLPPSLEAGLVYENRSIVNMFRAVGRGDQNSAEAARTAAEELRRVYET